MLILEREDIMRRRIETYDYGWVGDQPTFYLNTSSVNGLWVQYNDESLSFDIKLDKETLTYIISHSMRLVYPWCSTTGRLECGKYKTYKGESKQSRENAIKKLILDWFVGMYGSDNLLKKHFGESYEFIKEDYDKKFEGLWGEYFDLTQKAIKKFEEDYCLI
jgi:hypothetical protein